MNWTAVKWTNVLLALGFIALGLVLVFDARSSSHALEWPLALSPGRRRHLAGRAHRLVARVERPGLSDTGPLLRCPIDSG